MWSLCDSVTLDSRHDHRQAIVLLWSSSRIIESSSDGVKIRTGQLVREINGITRPEYSQCIVVGELN